MKLEPDRQASRLWIGRKRIRQSARMERLRAGHESLATQMAENLRVLATAKTVTEDVLTDVARMVGQQNRAKTYGTAGTMSRRIK